MKTVHLAAGKGTRLRPLTDTKPKPLVELGGRSLLQRNVETLQSVGVEDHVVVTGYRGEDIDALGYETVHNDVYDETEMIYSLFRAASAFPSGEDLVISYGDIVYEREFAERLVASDAPMAVAVDREWRDLWELRFEDPLEDAETLDLDTENRIRSIGASTDSYDDIDAQYTGLIKIRSDHVDRFIEAYRDLDADTEGYVSIDTTAFIQRLIDDGWDVTGVPVDGGWLEVDTLDDLETYRRMLDTETLSEFIEIES